MTQTGSARPLSPLEPGQPAPDFTLPAINREGEISLADYRGRSALLLALFRRLYCPFCRRAIAQLGVTADKLRPLGVETLAVVATAADRARLYFRYRPARVALVFTLLETASADATVAAGTRAAAVLPPPAPSLDGGAARAITPPEFFTEQEITAMRGGIASIYSIDPQADRYTDHGVGGPVEFAAFDARDAVPHRLYLGHGELFKLAGSEALPSLSHVRGVPSDFAKLVEAASGYVPWLHPLDHYGTLDPAPDQVVEAPAATWPEVAARRGSGVRHLDDQRAPASTSGAVQSSRTSTNSCGRSSDGRCATSGQSMRRAPEMPARMREAASSVVSRS